MNNIALRAAVLRLAHIKALKDEEFGIRQEIIKEFKKRGKDKIDLGGPTQEDYICLKDIQIYDVDPNLLLAYLSRRYDGTEEGVEGAIRQFIRCIRVVKRKLKDVFDSDDVSFISKQFNTLYCQTDKRITYKISVDENNQVRGIDL